MWGKDGDGKVGILQGQTNHPVPGLQNILQKMDPLHLEMSIDKPPIETFEIEDQPRAPSSFVDKEHATDKPSKIWNRKGHCALVQEGLNLARDSLLIWKGKMEIRRKGPLDGRSKEFQLKPLNSLQDPWVARQRLPIAEKKVNPAP